MSPRLALVLVLVAEEDAKDDDGVSGGVMYEPERRGEAEDECVLVCVCVLAEERVGEKNGERESEVEEDLCESVGEAARSRGRRCGRARECGWPYCGSLWREVGGEFGSELCT